MINKLFFNSDNNYPDDLLTVIKDEQVLYGHYALPDQDLSQLRQYKAEIKEKQPNINAVVVVGIGGSSLGAQAIYEFLDTKEHFKCRLYFLNSTNPLDIANICKQIEIEKTHFIISSKSGKTIEVIAIYKFLAQWVEKKHLDYQPFSFISMDRSPLSVHAKKNAATTLTIANNISGRFSVFSSIGLAPLILIGVDIEKLLYGAKIIKSEFFNKGNLQKTLLQKAYFYAKHSAHIHINTLFSYSQSLCYFNDWFVQLWAESLAKQQRHSSSNIGLTPIGLIGPKDQHSFLQLLAEGRHDKSITFIKLTDKHHYRIPAINLDGLEAFSNLDNLHFSTLINLQADATIEALKFYNIPIDVIELDQQNAQNIGELMMYFQLLTALVGILLDINTYNQPGVELTKKILNNKLQL